MGSLFAVTVVATYGYSFAYMGFNIGINHFIYQNVPEYPPLLGGWMAYPLPWPPAIIQRDLRQGGGEFLRELDAPQLCCGVLHCVCISICFIRCHSTYSWSNKKATKAYFPSGKLKTFVAQTIQFHHWDIEGKEIIISFHCREIPAMENKIFYPTLLLSGLDKNDRTLWSLWLCGENFSSLLHYISSKMIRWSTRFISLIRALIRFCSPKIFWR